jgi:NF-X1-type zinc finger protein NFXL1
LLFFLKNLLNEGRAAYTLPKKNHNILLKICINTCSSTYLISIKVNVRCACNNLKKEWICQDVLKEYRQSGRDPKQIPKNQYAVGLLACGEDCVKKVKAADSELHLRKIQEIKTPAVEVENVPKRRKRRNRGQESVESSKFQVC